LTSIPSIDRTADLLYVVKNTGLISYKVTPNVLLGVTGAPVGDTDVQTLSNKTITSPSISNPVLSGTLTGTYTIGGTPTFPATVVTTTNSVTVTNKTFTSPVINTPTITNASITADAITGFTSANTGTIYGASITAGIIASAAILNSVNTAALQNGAVTAIKMQYGVVRQRQGGTTGDNAWSTSGTSNTDTSAKVIFTQVGSVTSSDNTTTLVNGWYVTSIQSVTFPSAYTQVPIVIVCGSSDHAVSTINAITTTGFTWRARANTSIAASSMTLWMAVGQ
jgi:fibronectin-binding autotransporter adhesin